VLIAATGFAAQTTVSHRSAKRSATKRVHQASSAAKHKSSANGKNQKKNQKKIVERRGQQKIDSQRAQQIQQALIREHYLTGEASGAWDDTTQEAMRKFQADNGWQDKTTPDSRALIKLGLGPDHEHLLNPESAMTSPRAQVRPPSSSLPGDDAFTKLPQ
jgi:peptidoglycan hydrolase-like protein with peptidoglycan-binding domain